ncbi:hypothetical protein M885DRAFT_519421 [Pelagophyceae sp. CCMP2097]|nr:hypothetical protein M885DRAFT_519421 [Pelagophyceae sp. CCMP2097]
MVFRGGGAALLVCATAQHMTVLNRCPAQAHVSYRRRNTYSPYPTLEFSVGAMSNSVRTPCYEGRSVSVKLGSNFSCETESAAFACTSSDTRVIIECFDDPTSPAKCAAHAIGARCIGWGSMASYCPARSHAVATAALFLDYDCGSQEMRTMPNGEVLDFRTECPICKCTRDTECFGADCGSCGSPQAVTWAADTACVPHDWPPRAPAPDGPTQSPTRRIDDDDPTPSPTPRHGVPRYGPDDDSDTVENPKRKRSGVSTVATVAIAIVAALVAACAVRRAVVSQASTNVARAAMYADIPSHSAVGSTYQAGSREARRGDDASVEMMDRDRYNESTGL